MNLMGLNWCCFVSRFTETLPASHKQTKRVLVQSAQRTPCSAKQQSLLLRTPKPPLPYRAARLLVVQNPKKCLSKTAQQAIRDLQCEKLKYDFSFFVFYCEEYFRHMSLTIVRGTLRINKVHQYSVWAAYGTVQIKPDGGTYI